MQRALATVMVLALAAVAVAQAGSRTASPSESPEYQKLVADYEAAKKRVIPVVNHAEFARRALAAAGKASGEEQVPFLVFAAVNGRSVMTTGQAVDLLLEHHVGSPGLRGLLDNYEAVAKTLDADKGRQLLASAIKSPHPTVRALALYLDGERVLNARGASDEDKEQARAQLAEAQKLAAGTDLADRLGTAKGGPPNLQVGMPVPDIDGEDIDGTAFKLSDYRGKVVVLDFWGFW